MSVHKEVSGDTDYDTVHIAFTVERLGLSLGILGRELDTGQQRLVLSILLSSLLQCFLLKLLCFSFPYPSYSPLLPEWEGYPTLCLSKQLSFFSASLVLLKAISWWMAISGFITFLIPFLPLIPLVVLA